MAWKLDNDRQIWMQLADRLRHRIVSGAYPPGARIPSVRELAAEAGVNPNTMQRAMSGLEDSGLICAAGTAGRFVTEDTELLRSVQKQLAGEEIRQCRLRLQALGYTPEQADALWREETP